MTNIHLVTHHHQLQGALWRQTSATFMHGHYEACNTQTGIAVWAASAVLDMFDSILCWSSCSTLGTEHVLQKTRQNETPVTNLASPHVLHQAYKHLTVHALQLDTHKSMGRDGHRVWGLGRVQGWGIPAPSLRGHPPSPSPQACAQTGIQSSCSNTCACT